MSNISKRRREGSRTKIKSVGDHKEFLHRITRTLYYGQLPTLPCLSLPVTEVSCLAWSAAQRGRSLRRLHADAAADIARQACVSPCALVLALLYLERLHACNPHYLASAPPQDLFLVSLMVGNKFLQDDGEDDEVICSEWAESGGIDLKHLKNLEMEFLNAIEWNVFVSEKSFEAGLARLERRVAMRQAEARGFFTYGDLAAASEGGAAELACAAAACGALVLAYLAGLLAVLASAAAASHALLLAAPGASLARRPPALPVNATKDPLGDGLVAHHTDEATDRLCCCVEWARLLAAAEAAQAAREERERLPAPEWAGRAAWGRAPPLEPADPVRRWLGRQAGAPRRRCARPWPDLAALLVSDR